MIASFCLAASLNAADKKIILVAGTPSRPSPKANRSTAWVCERADGGPGFGFTGAHFHKNWGDGNFRKLVLNAMLWIEKAEVPPDGVESAITEEELQQNLDPKQPKPPAP